MATARSHGHAPSFTLVHVLLAVTVATGGVVMMEPAPYDLLLVATIALGPLLAWPSMRPSLALPYLLAALLLLANGASMLLMPDLDRGLRFFGVTAYLVIGWGLTAAWLNRFGPSLLELLASAYALGAGVTSVAAVAAYFGWFPGADVMLPDGRLQGLFKDPNVFGAFMVPAVLIAVARLDSKRRFSYFALMLVGTLGILLSYSRGSWINLTLSLLAYAGLRGLAGHIRPTPARIFGAFVALVVVGGLLIVAFDHPTVSDMLEIRASTQGYDDDRFANQAAALALGLEHPLGIGPGATEGHFTISAHSLYVRAFVENGFVGLCATAGLVLLSLARALWSALRPGDPDGQRIMAVVAAALCGAVIESAVIDSIHWRHLWLLLALAWAPLTAHRVRSESHARATARSCVG